MDQNLSSVLLHNVLVAKISGWENVTGGVSGGVSGEAILLSGWELVDGS